MEGSSAPRLRSDILIAMKRPTRLGEPTPFVILSTQRTGSTWVQDVLSSHPLVCAHGELFLEYGRGFPDSERFGPVNVEYFESWFRNRGSGDGPVSRARHAIPYLNQFYSHGDEVRAAGFKLMYSQLRRNPMVGTYTATRRVRVVHLVRKNLLNVLLSHATSDARGQAHAWAGEAVREVQVSLDPEATVTKLKALERQVSLARFFLRVGRLPVNELIYEDLFTDSSGFDEVFEFLGVDPEAAHALASSMKKLNSAPKDELIENWDELSQALVGTRFEQYLH